MGKNPLLEFGILNIDKPSGPTSFDVSDTVKKMLGLRKTSHFGTLDPKVTGVLPIALNRACKLTGFFLGHDKEYVGIMRFHEVVEEQKVKAIIKEKFSGVIDQIPPVRSRVARKLRQREIKSFELLEQNGKDFLFRTTVEGGTYIRKLIDDLGKELGIGAHMLELRRVRAGMFEEEKSFTLYELEKAIKEKKVDELIISGEEAVKTIFCEVQIKKESLKRIFHGQPIYHENLMKKKTCSDEERIGVFCGEQFVGIFKKINDKKIFAKSEFTLQPTP